MTGARHFAREKRLRERSLKKASDAGFDLELRGVTMWYARTIGTQQAPWLVRTATGETYRAERVFVFGPTATRLLTDDERELLPDKPRGIVEAERAGLIGAVLL